MKRKYVYESLEEFLNEKDNPLALAVLGAPAGGKSYIMQNITKTVKDSRIEKTLKSGVNLTIDVLRDEFRSKDPLVQLVGFVHAFYYMKEKKKEDLKEYGKWFDDIYILWKEKLNKLIPEVKIDVTENDIKFNDIPARKNIKVLKEKKINSKKIISNLDRYKDYKRVVRYFQNAKQEKAINKQYNISYDESGDEPKKIVKGLTKLHKSGYVTDVFLLHPENVATNLIQNYFRVIKGGDGGRDSSEVIIDAYLDIEKSKHYYEKNAEDNLKTTSQELKKTNPSIEEPLKKANVEDDKQRGDKPIDVFTEISTMKPLEAYKIFSEELNKDERLILKALLKYRMLSIKNLPNSAKKILYKITNDINNKQALEILVKAEKSGKYKFEYGGINSDLIKKATIVLK